MVTVTTESSVEVPEQKTTIHASVPHRIGRMRVQHYPLSSCEGRDRLGEAPVEDLLGKDCVLLPDRKRERRTP